MTAVKSCKTYSLDKTGDLEATLSQTVPIGATSLVCVCPRAKDSVLSKRVEVFLMLLQTHYLVIRLDKN